MAFKLGMTVDSRYNDHAHFDDLDLDARSQWLAEAENIQR